MNYLLLIFVLLAVVLTQFLAGGRTIALCLPAYALLALGAFLSWWPRRRFPIPRARTECLVAALILAGYVAVRALFSPEEYLARGDLYLAVGAFTLYLIVALNLTSSRWRMSLVAGLLVLASVNCGIGAVQFFTHQTHLPIHPLPLPEDTPRISGFYGYPNHLAAFLEISLMLALSMAFWSRWPTWAKLLSGYVAVMCIAGIAAAGSRGGYIAGTVGLLVFGLLCLALVGKLAPGRILGFLVAGLLLIGGTVWGFKAIVSKNFDLNWRAGATLTVDVTRMRLWQAAWKQFRLQRVVGTGSGTTLYYGRQFRSPAVQTDPVHAHNDYFELLAEYGIVGIIIAVIFLETHLRTGWNAFRQRLAQGGGGEGLTSNSIALNVGALSAAATCLVYCLLDFTLHMAANVLVMALIFALLGSPGAGPEAAPEDDPEMDLPPFLRLILPALGVFIVVRILPSTGAEFFAERCRVLMSDWHFTTSPEVARQLRDLSERGLRYDQRNPELYYSLGQGFSNQADLDPDPAARENYRHQAISAFQKAIELAPHDVNYFLDCGAQLDAARRFTDSDPLFARALQLDPNSARVSNALGAHLEAQGKFADATERYHEAMRLGGGMLAQLGLDRIEEAQKAKGADAPPTPKLRF